MRYVFALVAVAGAAVAFACGGPEAAAPPAAEPEVKEAPRPKGPSMVVSQEMGSLDPTDVDRQVRTMERELFKCQENGTDRLPFMFGNLKFQIRLSADGKMKWIHIEESTLGDRETEACMRSALERTPWPKPIGGEGEIRKSFGFTLGDARAPFAWNADKLHEGLSKADAEIKKCKGTKRASFKAVVYIVPTPPGEGPDGGDTKDGKVVAASAVASDRSADDAIDCIVGALKGMKVPSPGEHAAKVAFTL